MIRDLPVVGGGLVWINRGPLFNLAAVSFADLIAALKEVYVNQRGFYLRIAPPFPAASQPSKTNTAERPCF